MQNKINRPERKNFQVEIKTRSINDFNKWEDRKAEKCFFENQKTFNLYLQRTFLNSNILEIRFNYNESPQGHYIFNPNISNHYTTNTTIKEII